MWYINIVVIVDDINYKFWKSRNRFKSNPKFFFLKSELHFNYSLKKYFFFLNLSPWNEPSLTYILSNHHGDIIFFHLKLLRFYPIYNVLPNYQFSWLTTQFERIVSICSLHSKLVFKWNEILLNYYKIILVGYNKKKSQFSYNFNS